MLLIVSRPNWYRARRPRAETDLVVREAVARIENSKGSVDVAVLARELALSTRQLERRFLAAVGLSPKKSVVSRGLAVCLRPLGSRPVIGCETAVSCGFYDQAHLIRDCRRLVGVTPANLLGADADLARHFYRRLEQAHCGVKELTLT